MFCAAQFCIAQIILVCKAKQSRANFYLQRGLSLCFLLERFKAALVSILIMFVHVHVAREPGCMPL